MAYADFRHNQAISFIIITPVKMVESLENLSIDGIGST